MSTDYLDILDGREAEIGELREMTEELAGIAARCRDMGISVDEICSAQDALLRELEEAEMAFGDLLRHRKEWERAQCRAESL